jgi:hypothetical protein
LTSRTVTDPKTGKSYLYPVAGEDVYIDSMLFVTHGIDDFRGGLCEIVDVFDGMAGLSVRVKECPDWEFSWLHLMESQDEWREEFGDQRGFPDPDYRPEFNEPDP